MKTSAGHGNDKVKCQTDFSRHEVAAVMPRDPEKYQNFVDTTMYRRHNKCHNTTNRKYRYKKKDGVQITTTRILFF
jgi:hypothetical protein